MTDGSDARNPHGAHPKASGLPAGSLQALLERLGVGILLFRGQIFGPMEPVWDNKCLRHLLGCAPESFAETGITQILSERIRPEHRQYIEETFQAGQALREEIHLKRPSGSTFWGALELFPESDGLWCLKLEDITRRKQAEEQLGADQERLSAVLKNLGEGVLLVGARREIDFLNREAERLTGIILNKAVGRPVSSIFTVIGEHDRSQRACPVARVFKSGQTCGPVNDCLLRDLSGGERKIQFQVAPIKDLSGHISGAVVVFRDVSSQSLFEREMQKMQKMESLTLLADGIAHDFNNILTGILGNISLARTCLQPDGRVENILKTAEKAAERAKDLTHRLMTFSRGSVATRTQVSLKELLRESAGFILSGSKCHCRTEIDAELWPAEVDEGQLSQVINNLLINANQAMPEGGVIRISAQNVDIGEGSTIPLEAGHYVKIAVIDEGTGIQPEHLTRIFDPYFTTKKNGSGLGLATCYSIVRSHGGHIMVDSTVASGATFTFYLPALADSVVLTHKEKARLYHGKGRVLVMDDEQMIRQITGDMLTHLGYEVDFAADGEQALEIYRMAEREGNAFDVIIMDLTIPGGLGGKEAMAALEREFPQARCIVSTGYSKNPILANYEKYGFCGAVTKPYNIEQLSWVLNNILSKDG